MEEQLNEIIRFNTYNNDISALAYTNDSQKLAVGFSTGVVEIWLLNNTTSSTRIRVAGSPCHK